MKSNKIIRCLCYFTNELNAKSLSKLEELRTILENQEFEIQTKRICTNAKKFESLRDFDSGLLMLSLGTLSYDEIQSQLAEFYTTNNVSFNIDLTEEYIEERHIQILFDIIKKAPGKTFNFT